MTISSNIFGFASFGSAWMLLWGLAAVVPVVIHLWSKRRYQETTWAAMEYLLSAVRRNARRIRIEQLILLAIRVAILLLFALALADPILSLVPGFGQSLTELRRRHTVLVIDGSYSMDYKSSASTRFRRAQELAGSLVQQCRQGDGFTLVLLSDPARVIIGSPAFDPEDVINEIEGLKLPHAGADLLDTLARIEEILEKARRDHSRLRNAAVYFFTDLGTTTWKEAAGAKCRAQLARIDQQASITLVDLGQAEDTENLAVTDLHLPQDFATAGQPLALQATIKNFGSRTVAEHPIEFIVDGRRTGQQHLTVPANESVTVEFHYRFDAPGEHWVQARLAADPLEVDNHRYLAVPIRRSLNVLCIGGKQGAARNVALALQPHDESEQTIVRAQTVSESALLELDLDRYDCVFLCNIGRFGRDEAGVLYEYLQAGGGLVFFLGDQVHPDSYNLELGGELSGQRVLPARIGSLVGPGEFRFDPLDYRHRIVSAFRGHERTGLLTTPVWFYYQLVPVDDAQAKTALRFEGGDPAIVEEQILRGRSILVATAASEASLERSTTPPTPWTALASWPSFPPLIHEMLALAIQGRYEDRNVTVGQPIQTSVRSVAANLSLTVARGEDLKQRVRTTLDGQDSLWTFADTEQSGIYEARYESADLPTQYFAVNVDTSESDPARVDPDELPGQFNRETAADPAQRATLSLGDSTWPLFRVVLGGILVLLLLETFLARQFGVARA